MDKKALFDLSYGVYVVSTKYNEKKAGCVVNSIFQVTSSPATIAISISKNNYTNECILRSKKFAIAILTEKSDSSIIGTFGFKTSKDIDKFENVNFIVTDDGVPVLTSNTCSYILCNVVNSMDCLTHTIIVGEISNAVKLNNDAPMTYSYYHKVIKGKSPQNAPTYIKEESGQPEERYVCSVCGYVYEGTKEEFEALPDSYECPICSVPKALFNLQTV